MKSKDANVATLMNLIYQKNENHCCHDFRIDPPDMHLAPTSIFTINIFITIILHQTLRELDRC